MRNIPILALRPTQVSLGYREVARKRAEWRVHRLRHGEAWRPADVVPVVLGPGGAPYALDRHHLARALHEEGVETLPIEVSVDASSLSPEAFWRFLATRSWGRRIDAFGRPVDYRHMPGTVAEMKDDPYRSLAGALRRAGGFPKRATPCWEFQWADRLRRCIDARLVRENFDAALAQALSYAGSANAVSTGQTRCA